MPMGRKVSAVLTDAIARDLKARRDDVRPTFYAIQRATGVSKEAPMGPFFTNLPEAVKYLEADGVRRSFGQIFWMYQIWMYTFGEDAPEGVLVAEQVNRRRQGLLVNLVLST